MRFINRPGTHGEASDIANVFAGGIKQQIPAGHDFESGQISNLTPIVQWILRNFMVPWLLKVLKKYTEAQFHDAMNGQYTNSSGQVMRGRDFVADFYQNHRKSFGAFLKVARKNRKVLNVDINDQVNRLVMVLNKKGWKVYPHERQCFVDTLRKIMQIIYS